MRRFLLRAGLVATAAAVGVGVWWQRGLRASAGPHQPTPRLTLGAYAAPRTVADAARWQAFLARADTTALNAVVLDLTTPAGVHFRSENTLAARIAAPAHLSYDLAARVAQAHAPRLFVIGRLEVARAPRLVHEKPRWAIRTPRGRTWTDARGRTALDVTNEDACEFVGRIAQEAARAGVDEVMLDALEVPPPAPGRPRLLESDRHDQPTYRAVAECARTIAGPVRRAHAQLGIAVTGALCFDVAQAGRNGQRWEDLALVADRMSPEIYPRATRVSVGRTSARPYQAVSAAVGMCYTRTLRLIKAQNGEPVRIARLEPWIRAYGPGFGPDALAEELRALREHGVGNALLWNGESDYDPFLPALRQSPAGPVIAYNPSAAQWTRANRAPLPERGGGRGALSGGGTATRRRLPGSGGVSRSQPPGQLLCS